MQGYSLMIRFPSKITPIAVHKTSNEVHLKLALRDVFDAERVPSPEFY